MEDTKFEKKEKTYTIQKTGKEITKTYLDIEELDGKSEEQIAEKLGISRVGLWKIRKKMGCPQSVRSDKGTVRVDAEDQRLRKNSYMRQYAETNNIKYLVIVVNGKRISEHRHVMQQFLGRDLLPGEIVHHDDENTRNNVLGNLRLFTGQKEHLAFHRHKKIERMMN